MNTEAGEWWSGEEALRGWHGDPLADATQDCPDVERRVAEQDVADRLGTA